MGEKKVIRMTSIAPVITVREIRERLNGAHSDRAISQIGMEIEIPVDDLSNEEADEVYRTLFSISSAIPRFSEKS